MLQLPQRGLVLHTMVNISPDMQSTHNINNIVAWMLIRYPSGLGNEHFVQPYERVFIDLNRQVDFKMKDYLAWNMEGEHGDLGLGSTHLNKPPLSKLGTRLQGLRKQDLQEMLVLVNTHADGNICMAKMRMDLVHESEAHQQKSELLPDVVVNMFDAVIEGMMHGPAPDAMRTHLGLRAIVAFTFLSRRFDPSFDEAVNFTWLALALQQVARDTTVETCAMHTILQAASGLLVIERVLSDRVPDTTILQVVYFNTAFKAYMVGGYNTALREFEENMSRDPGVLAILSECDTKSSRVVEWLTDVDENTVDNGRLEIP